MRVLVALTVAGSILAANIVFAQDVETGMTGDELGILASAERAALRLGLQPNAGAQRARRGGRLKAGWTLVAVGGGLVLGGMYLASRPGGYYDSSRGGYVETGGGTVGLLLSLTGIGVAGVGGVLVARADVTSRVRFPDRGLRAHSAFRVSQSRPRVGEDGVKGQRFRESQYRRQGRRLYKVSSSACSFAATRSGSAKGTRGRVGSRAWETSLPSSDPEGGVHRRRGRRRPPPSGPTAGRGISLAALHAAGGAVCSVPPVSSR